MKKLLSFFVLSFVVFCLLVSCSSSVQEKEPEYCNVTFYFNNIYEESSYGAVYKDAACTEPYNVEEVVSFEKGEIGYDCKLVVQVEKNTYCPEYKFYILDGQEVKELVSGVFEYGTENDDVAKFYFNEVLIDRDIEIFTSGTDCIIAGTKVNKANGETVLIEDIKVGDKILTWDFYEGKLVENEVIAVEEHKQNTISIMEVVTSCGYSVKFTYCQSFYDVDEKDYFQINILNHKKSLGKNILVVDPSTGELFSTEIERIDISKQNVASYDVYTAKAFNFFADNILTLYPGYFGHTLCEVDDNFKYNANELKAMREKYGIATYNEYKKYISSEDIFNAFRLEDINIMIAKGFFTKEKFLNDLQWFKDTFTY